jgi:hypothetical protein
VTSMVLETPIVDEEMYRQLLARRRRLTDRQVDEMLRTIRPVVRDGGGNLRYIEPAQPRHFAYLRDPKFTNEEVAGLRVIKVICTLHPFGYRDRFVPAIDEVLSMIPEKLLADVVAFEVVGPRGEADLTRQRFLFEECDYHVAATILYAAS